MHVYFRLRRKYTLAEEIIVCSKKLALALLPTTFNAMAILFCFFFCFFGWGWGAGYVFSKNYFTAIRIFKLVNIYNVYSNLPKPFLKLIICKSCYNTYLITFAFFVCIWIRYTGSDYYFFCFLLKVSYFVYLITKYDLINSTKFSSVFYFVLIIRHDIPVFDIEDSMSVYVPFYYFDESPSPNPKFKCC